METKYRATGFESHKIVTTFAYQWDNIFEVDTIVDLVFRIPCGSLDCLSDIAAIEIAIDLKRLQTALGFPLRGAIGASAFGDLVQVAIDEHQVVFWAPPEAVIVPIDLGTGGGIEGWGLENELAIGVGVGGTVVLVAGAKKKGTHEDRQDIEQGFFHNEKGLEPAAISVGVVEIELAGCEVVVALSAGVGAVDVLVGLRPESHVGKCGANPHIEVVGPMVDDAAGGGIAPFGAENDSRHRGGDVGALIVYVVYRRHDVYLLYSQWERERMAHPFELQIYILFSIRTAKIT